MKNSLLKISVLVLLVSSLVGCQKKVPQTFIVQCGKWTVDYSRSVADSVEAGEYDWPARGFTKKNFPSTETGELEVDMAMFSFNYCISSNNVITEMGKAGYRPATLKELLAYGEKNPDAQRLYMIVELASVAELRGSRWVGYLYSRSGNRDLDLYAFDGCWGGGFCFLAVRKVSAP